MLPEKYSNNNKPDGVQSCPQCHGIMRQIGSFDGYMANAARTASDARLHFDAFIECTSCGFIQVTPMFAEADLTYFYQHYRGSAGYSNKGSKKIIRTFKRLRRLRRYVSGGDFLDVGCNLGFAVEAARMRGFNANGIEIDAEAVARARQSFPGCNFVATSVSDYNPTAGFDLIYCSEVIEHVPDTVDFVKHLARITKPGGHLFITTPDAGHWRRPKQFIAWPEVKPPEHVSWQTQRSMRHLLVSNGFAEPKFFFKLKPGMHLIARKV